MEVELKLSTIRTCLKFPRVTCLGKSNIGDVNFMSTYAIFKFLYDLKSVYAISFLYGTYSFFAYIYIVQNKEKSVYTV